MARLGTSRVTVRSLVAEVAAEAEAAAAAAVDMVAAAVVDVDQWSATTATKRGTCRGSVLRDLVAADVVAAAAAVEAAAVATATTAVSLVIFPATAQSPDKVVAVDAAAVDAAAAAVAAAVVDVTTFSATVARDTVTCLGNAPSDFQLDDKLSRSTYASAYFYY